MLHKILLELQTSQLLNLQGIPGDTADLVGMKTASLPRRNSKKLGVSTVAIPLPQTTYFINKQEHTQEKFEENLKKTPGLIMSRALPPT